MTTFVLMTAMPPTVGHVNLIRFAARRGEPVKVILCTKPGEPFVTERYQALNEAVASSMLDYRNMVTVKNLHRDIEQDPAAPGFWDMWKSIMTEFGAKPGDTYVTSEPYGKTMAEVMNGKFIPFDPERQYHNTKATPVRAMPYVHFDWIAPEFKKYLRTKVTIFGAESTGKTTLASLIAQDYHQRARWIHEYARPYLTYVDSKVTRVAMFDIWTGQSAIQEMAEEDTAEPILIQDTDLYSTIGYWEQPHQTDRLGPVPGRLIFDAEHLQSDLYIITPSNIPFEADPIRYGDGVRESPDEFWVGVAEKYGLNYVLLTSPDLGGRLSQALEAINEVSRAKQASMQFDRGGF